MCRQRICRVAVLAFLLASCQDFLIYDVFLDPLTIDPGSTLIYSDETASFSASGGRPTYVFSVISGGGSIDPKTGVYTAPSAASEAVIQVSDATGKSARANVQVLGPRPITILPSSASLVITESCAFSHLGGIPPYYYAVTSGDGSIDSSTGVFTAGTSSGVCTVTLTDGRGISDTATVTVQEPQPVAISPSAVSMPALTSCTFSGLGGIPPYSYVVASGDGNIDSSTGVFTAGAAVGTTVVALTDGRGQSASATISVREPDSVGILPSAITLVITESCTFSPLGGVPPYYYAIASGNGSIGSSTGVFTAGTTAGTTTVILTDKRGISATATITVQDPQPVTITPSSVSLPAMESCTFAGHGGLLPYSYAVTSGNGTIDSSTGVYTAGTAAGTTIVTLTDGRGQSASATVSVQEPEPLFILPSAVSLLITKSCLFTSLGGIPPYFYAITSGSGSIDNSSGLFTAGSAGGTSTVTLTDGRGISATATISVQEPQHVSIMPALVAVKTSSATWFTAVGGQSPYVFTQLSGSGSMSAAGLYTAGASSETAVVMVTDALGVTSSATVTVVADGVLGLNATATSVEEGKTAIFSAYGGTPDYYYSLSTCGSGGNINGVTGEYTAGHVVGSNIDTVLVADSEMPSATVELNVTVLPAIPTDLVADGSYGNPHEIALVWTDNSTSEDGFLIERKSGAGSFAAVGYTAADVTTFVDASCSPNVGYTYRVMSYKGALYSAPSNEAFSLPN